MCGILGWATASPEAASKRTERQAAALQSLQHRGPDGQGEYRHADLWLAHTRLKILDLSEAGAQPMLSANDRFVLSYNGEVYNFRELIATHGLRNLSSHCDAEVVLELFAKLGPRSFAELNGMFAFALLDKAEQKLWLVRDRVGIKPLYYRMRADELVFASEIKGILAIADERQTCKVSALHEWLYYGTSLNGQTLYEGIEQLRPGCFMEFDLASYRHVTREYWSLLDSKKRALEKPAVEDPVVETREHLEQAVRRQLVSDVPVGVFLSGGIDSSAVAAFASRHYEHKLATYAAGFDFAPDGGELPKAKRVAELYGTDHHEVHVAGADIADVVEKMVAHHDLPFADAANIPLYLMAKQLPDVTKVVLQGDGGDELFGGYRRYSTLTYHRILRPLAKLLRKFPRALPASVSRFRLERYLNALGAEDLGATVATLLTAEDPQSDWLSAFSPEFARRILDSTDPFHRYRDLQESVRDLDVRDQMSLLDIAVVLPDTYLEKVDRSTMAASLETRVPFLDNDLLDFVVGLPASEKLPYGRKKWLLKQSLKGIVPDEILFGPKRGFQVPYRHWLQTSLKSLFFDNLHNFVQTWPDVLNEQGVQSLYERTRRRQRDYSPLLWKLLNLMLWAEQTNIQFTEEV